jgi:succinyl-diaminopimelate desuccinylase
MVLGKLIESYKNDIVRKTQDIVKIRSVEDEAKDGMPYGEGVNEALEYALRLSSELGFNVENFDGYAGHAEIGSGDETVGVLVHLDVVPEGEGWSYPPYAAEIHDDKIFGRGTIDDKGPAIAILYAMKAIKESGLNINKKIRIIFGTNEETEWGGITYYLKKQNAPDIAFTPDADFPVIHGEKGIIVFDLAKDVDKMCSENVKIKSISGGNRPNMVPDSCTAILSVNTKYRSDFIKKFEDFIKETRYKIQLVDNGEDIILKSQGVSAHGSTPQSGQNAISQLIVLLAKIIDCDCDICSFIKAYNKKIGMDYNGQSIGCGFEDDISGKLVFNVGMINVDSAEAKVTVNIRYPIKYAGQQVYDGIRAELKGTGIEVIEGEDMKPLYVSKDHELVQTLMKVYREETGDLSSEPITIGGGTYARSMKNAVAFGPLFPGQVELAHQKDECISINDLINISKIYAKALYELTK